MTSDSGTPGARATVAWQGRIIDVAHWRAGHAAASADTDRAARDVLAAARDGAGPAGLRHLVVGVIGPRAATDVQAHTARALGRALGHLSVTTICGGRSGVMEAVCAGVQDVGGLSIGILPGSDPDSANGFVGIPLPTGLNEGRNMVIARAARVLIAVGGSHGTLTEIAFGLHFAKPVIALEDAPDIAGVIRAADVDAAMEMCCASLLDQAVAEKSAPRP